jgi:tetratricopeptide (TPR) repeat protein
LAAGELRANLRAVLSWSVHALSPGAASLFGLLGIAPGPDIGLPATAALAALSVTRARLVLRELEHASLVQQHSPGRYRMHDLVRLFAADTARHDPAEDAWHAALRRVVDFYTHTAHAADRLLHPERDPASLAAPAAGVRPYPLPTTRAALAWCEAEHGCLLAAQRAAVAQQWPAPVWVLAWAMDSFHTRRGHRHHRLAVWQAATTAGLTDPAARAMAYRITGNAHADLGHHAQALDFLHRALALAEHHHDANQQAHTHNALARAWGEQGDDRRALAHATSAFGLFRDLDQPVRQGRTLSVMGWFAGHLGDYDIAHAHCQAGLALNRAHHDAVGEASTLDSLGYIAHHSGRHQEAVDYYQLALARYWELGDSYEATDTLDRLGQPYLALHEPERARTVWRDALRLYREQGRTEDENRVRRQLDALDGAELDGADEIGADEKSAGQESADRTDAS